MRPVILAVDDDEGLLESLHLVLDDRYEVLDARDGLAALAVLTSREVDLVLLDILQDGIDGITILEELRALDKHVPVVVVSGIGAAAVATTAMRLGAVDYVTKPFDEDHLLAVVESALGHAGASDHEPPRILVAGCDVGLAASLTVLLSPWVDVETLTTLDDLARALDDARPDLVVVDASGATRTGARLVALVDAACWRGPVILIDGPVFAPGDRAGVPAYSTLRRPVRLAELLDELADRLPPARRAWPRFSPQVLRIVEYVGDHVPSVGVRDLGRVVGRSSYNLSRSFRQDTGMPLKTFLNRARVEAARQLLRATSEKIETVATRVGFHDASHLSRMFLKYSGQRPGDLRRSGRRALPGV